MPDWPPWWEWEIELSAHLLERMIDRNSMLDRATGYYENHEEGRWCVETRLGGQTWEIIVEPVPEDGVLLVVTAYPITEQ